MSETLRVSTLALPLGFSALAIGGVPTKALRIYLLLVLCAGAVALWLARSARSAPASSQGTRSCAPAAVWLGLSWLCWVQALPLPVAGLEVIVPENLDIWQQALATLDEGPASWLPWSLAPGRSLTEAAKLAALALVFLLARRVSSASGLGPVCWIAFGWGVLVAVVTAAHQALDLQRVYGWYESLHASSVSPLPSANSRAGYLNLAFFCGLGLLFSRNASFRWPIGMGLITLAAEAWMCQSRGGVATWLLGLTVLSGVLLLSKRFRSGDRVWLGAVPLLVPLLGLILAMIAQRRRGWALLLDNSLDKVELLRASWDFAMAHQPLGVGRGAFGSAFPRHQHVARVINFDFAENLPLQWLSEWGWPATVLALGLLAVTTARSLSRGALQRPSQLAPIVGCAVLFIHNLGDLSFEIPAVASLWIAILGGLSGASYERRLRKSGQQAASDVRWLQVATATLALAIVLSEWKGSERLPRLRETVHAALVREPVPTKQFWDALNTAIRQYPAEPYFPLLGGHAALATGGNALPWLNRALERGPNDIRGYLLGARILHQRAADRQAATTLREALRRAASAREEIVPLVHSWSWPIELVVETAPQGPAGAEFLLHYLDLTTKAANRHAILRAALERAPGNKKAHYHVAQLLHDQLSEHEQPPLCDLPRSECIRLALQHAERARRPDNPDAELLTARLLVVAADPEAARSLVQSTCRRFPRSLRCLRYLLLYTEPGDPSFQDGSERFLALSCSTREACAAAHSEIGHTLRRRKRWHQALFHFRAAIAEHETPERWQDVARAAQQLGQASLARSAARHASALTEAGSAYRPRTKAAHAEGENGSPR